MDVQAARLGETPLTHPAQIWLLTSMRAEMGRQVAGLGELFGTKLAFERLARRRTPTTTALSNRTAACDD